MRFLLGLSKFVFRESCAISWKFFVENFYFRQKVTCRLRKARLSRWDFTHCSQGVARILAIATKTLEAEFWHVSRQNSRGSRFLRRTATSCLKRIPDGWYYQEIINWNEYKLAGFTAGVRNLSQLSETPCRPSPHASRWRRRRLVPNWWLS